MQVPEALNAIGQIADQILQEDTSESEADEVGDFATIILQAGASRPRVVGANVSTAMTMCPVISVTVL